MEAGLLGGGAQNVGERAEVFYGFGKDILEKFSKIEQTFYPMVPFNVL